MAGIKIWPRLPSIHVLDMQTCSPPAQGQAFTPEAGPRGQHASKTPQPAPAVLSVMTDVDNRRHFCTGLHFKAAAAVCKLECRQFRSTLRIMQPNIKLICHEVCRL